VMERTRVHDVALGDAVLSTLPDWMEAKVQWSKVLNQMAVSLSSRCLHWDTSRDCTAVVLLTARGRLMHNIT